MRSAVHLPLTRVWAVVIAIFLLSAWIARMLSRRGLVMPSYWTGLVGLLAIGVALFMSWRGIGDPGVHSRAAIGVLRGLVGIGAMLWVLAMLFPFL
ncbi:MAG: hypothetical protein M3081_11270 [Gemmatimonadota bacterium]|nr:hypothetical protein [Gemmatimonadota bacterium]